MKKKKNLIHTWISLKISYFITVYIPVDVSKKQIIHKIYNLFKKFCWRDNKQAAIFRLIFDGETVCIAFPFKDNLND